VGDVTRAPGVTFATLSGSVPPGRQAVHVPVDVRPISRADDHDEQASLPDREDDAVVAGLGPVRVVPGRSV
jgi:hypothetical protein